MAKQTSAAKPGIISRNISFIREVKAETDKVTWLSRLELKSNTQVVLLFLVIFSVIIAVMDVFFLNIVRKLFALM